MKLIDLKMVLNVKLSELFIPDLSFESKACILKVKSIAIIKKRTCEKKPQYH